MKTNKLQELLGVPKVPSHPDNSSFREHLSAYSKFCKVGSQVLSDSNYKEVLEHFQNSIESEEVTDEEYYVYKMFLHHLDETIVQRRRVKNKRPKSRHLSRLAKKRVKKYKRKYNRALNRFHKSAKGKDFHRSLGKSLRKSVKKEEQNENYYVISDDEIYELMKSLSSGLTHFIIEYQNAKAAEWKEDFEVELLDFIIELADSCLKELTQALQEDSYDRYEIYFDVVNLAGEILIQSGIETEYEYEDEED